MASSSRLSPFETQPTTTQLAESPILNAEQPQGPQIPAEDLMVTGGNTERQRDRSRSEVRTPELQTTTSHTNNNNQRASGSLTSQEGLPTSPGQIPSFDWEEFETLYEQALAKANEEERELLHEFDSLIKYFNVWASAASAHDNERAVKRLQTRERYVRIAEQSLSQRKQHLTEVVRAFQSALALLSQN
ncbi:hypothetical protein RB594_000479 [Gaeumannomyces avenae]